MLENQFIQFLTEAKDDCVPVPILQGDDIKYCTGSTFAGLEIIDSNGNERIIHSSLYEVTSRSGYKEVEVSKNAFGYIGLGQCFRLRELTELSAVSLQLQNLYWQSICEDTEYAVAEGEDTLTAGDYTMVFDGILNILGEWSLENPTTLVDGVIHVYLIGQTKTTDAGYFEFRNGQLINDSLSFSITENSALYMDISVSRVDGSAPDCQHCDLWLRFGTTPPSLYKKTKGKISNSISVYATSDDFAKLKYYCDEDAFGFPFSTMDNYPEVALPIRLHSPQNVQDNKTYVKADGSVVTLYAKYYKEWECETEYLPEDMHDKIVAALSCDVVLINNVRVTKSDKYEVDWDKYDIACDDETKLAKATFKVRANITQRNSNY